MMVIDTQEIGPCRSCGSKRTGKYCADCGQLHDTTRISLKKLLHDVFHFFTHLEKGFGYTLKQLLVAPGTMQRLYVDGVRSRHQKPFSMYIICATINAVLRYWLFRLLINYFGAGDRNEADFFHEYMVLVFALLIPVVTLVNWLLFARSRYNYAETGVLQLYIFSFILIMATLISLLKLIWHDLDTIWIEFPVVLVYTLITFLNFYNTEKRWSTILKAILMCAVLFALVQQTEDLVISLIRSR